MKNNIIVRLTVVYRIKHVLIKHVKWPFPCLYTHMKCLLGYIDESLHVDILCHILLGWYYPRGEGAGEQSRPVVKEGERKLLLPSFRPHVQTSSIFACLLPEIPHRGQIILGSLDPLWHQGQQAAGIVTTVGTGSEKIFRRVDLWTRRLYSFSHFFF